MSQPTIDALLARRQAWRTGTAGHPASAHGHLHLNRYLWNQYETFAGMRRTLSRNTLDFARLAGNGPAQRLVDRLAGAGIFIRANNGTYRYRSRLARRYLTGGWLEELAYCAMLAAGADEAFYAQQIGWAVNGRRGTNEVDVLARRGNVLSFVSCKTASPILRRDRRSHDRLENQIFEAHYWDQHFAEGHGRAMLIVTTDLVDEAQKRERSAKLFARAEVLDVDLIGRDFFTWDRLIAAMRRHW